LSAHYYDGQLELWKAPWSNEEESEVGIVQGDCTPVLEVDLAIVGEMTVHVKLL
jgi:hypothetical protein